MTGDRTARLRLVPATAADPLGRLLADLPPAWHREVIGPGIDGWERIVEAGRDRPIRLPGLPPRLRHEIAWMAHWQHCDGLKVSVDVCNQLASVLTWAAEAGRPLPPSLAWAGKQDLLQLHGVWFHARHGRLPAEDSGRRVRLGRMLGYPRLALAARLHDGAWWELDTWHPRCDPRIPLREREPMRSVGCSPGDARLPWVRDALKWHLGMLLESGTLTWSTLSGQRSSALLRFARWLETLPEPAEAVQDASRAGGLAASFRRWAFDPASRSSAHRPPETVTAGKVNLDIWAVAELMAFLVDHRQEAARILGPSPWDRLTDAHPAIWLRQRTRERRHQPVSDETHYVDDHALAQISACLPALAEPGTRTVTVASGGITRVLAGQGDPQLMRMLLLQILTGRRATPAGSCAARSMRAERRPGWVGMASRRRRSARCLAVMGRPGSPPGNSHRFWAGEPTPVCDLPFSISWISRLLRGSGVGISHLPRWTKTPSLRRTTWSVVIAAIRDCCWPYSRSRHPATRSMMSRLSSWSRRAIWSQRCRGSVAGPAVRGGGGICRCGQWWWLAAQRRKSRA